MIDLLDLVRSIAAAAERAAENKHYPTPCSQGSPLLASVRQACVERGYTGDGLAVPGMAAPSAQPSAVPEGWTLVPVEPNDAMQTAGAQAVRIDTTVINKIWTGNAVFRAMIAAAPAAPAAQDDAKDACAEMRALCSACGGTGDVHGLDGEWRGQCTCVQAWQQRAEKAEADLKQVNEWRAAALTESQTLGELWASKVEQAEARVKELQAELDIELERAYDRLLAARTNKQADRQVLQADGRHPAPCTRDCEAPAFKNQMRERDARIAQLEARLVRRRALLSPETQQAIAAARAAGQTVAATPGGLVFMNDGAEPGSSELDCPACGGSGHVGDVVAGSAP